MKFDVIRKKITIGESEVVGVACFEGDDFHASLIHLEEELRSYCLSFLERTVFDAAKGKLLNIPYPEGKTKNILLIGMGALNKAKEDDFRIAAFSLVRAATEEGRESVSLSIPGAEESQRSRSIAEGAYLAGYRFSKYLSRDPKDRFASPVWVGFQYADEQGLEEGRILAKCQCYSRNLCNEPGNVINPETLEAEARRLASELGLECDVTQTPQMEAKGMGALCAVGRGSATPPRLIRLTWTPEVECAGSIALIGKGLTFDSGGLSLKPADGMITMKGDKTGGCVVLGAIRAAALLKLPIKVHALIGAAENMPGGNAYRPDDILRAYNGKTIEINNTDAEGRLTLADVLAYTSAELKPDEIIDIATLTGACGIALGENTTGLFTNDADFAERFKAAAATTGERFWELPMDDEGLRKKLKSPVADLVNSGGRYGGAITAAMFLEAFVGKDIPWIHLDIAAADFVKEPYSYYVKGATAYGMRTLVTYLIERIKRR